MQDPVNRPKGLTSNLSLKVPPEFAARIREAADCRGVQVSVILRERLGLLPAPSVLPAAGTSPTTVSAPVRPPSRPQRPQNLAPPSGSDPVVVRLLASVANGLTQIAKAVQTTHVQLSDNRSIEMLGMLEAMSARLDTLINHEDRKGAH